MKRNGEELVYLCGIWMKARFVYHGLVMGGKKRQRKTQSLVLEIYTHIHNTHKTSAIFFDFLKQKRVSEGFTTVETNLNRKLVDERSPNP